MRYLPSKLSNVSSQAIGEKSYETFKNSYFGKSVDFENLKTSPELKRIETDIHDQPKEKVKESILAHSRWR